jgi:hypothetical protein
MGPRLTPLIREVDANFKKKAVLSYFCDAHLKRLPLFAQAFVFNHTKASHHKQKIFRYEQKMGGDAERFMLST